MRDGWLRSVGSWIVLLRNYIETLFFVCVNLCADVGLNRSLCWFGITLSRGSDGGFRGEFWLTEEG